MPESSHTRERRPTPASPVRAPHLLPAARAVSPADSLEEVLLLQRSLGNQEVQRLLGSGVLQAKLSTGQHEGESQALPLVEEVLRSSGEPLDPATRASMEARLGHDFRGVRVHDDAQAAGSAHAVGAKAYTVGRDVVLAEPAGDRLLAHELVHVVQQRRDQGPARVRRQPAAQVGPVSGEGGLVEDTSRKRLSVIIGPGDSLRSVAATVLRLWRTATPFVPEGAIAPSPVPAVTAGQLARALLVYNRYYLGLPQMTKWRVGLRLPLPVEVSPAGGQRTLSPGAVVMWADAFDGAWLPLLDRRAATATTPAPSQVTASARDLLQEPRRPDDLGARLAAMAMTNALETAPLVEEVLRQSGGTASDVALAFMEQLVTHQVQLLASQRPGLMIIRAVRAALPVAPAGLAPDRRQSLSRARKMLESVATFSEATAGDVQIVYWARPAGTNCMRAFYRGLGGLFGREAAAVIESQALREASEVERQTGRNTHNIIRVLEAVESRGKAAPAVTLTYNARAGRWDPDPEATVLGVASEGAPGWYFFGVSLHRAWHSVALAVDRTDPAHPHMYWMDQGHGQPPVRDVTGRLSEEMRRFVPWYGFQPTKVWQLIPAADTLVELR